MNLAVEGANLYYELRGTGPLVVLFAAPGDAGGFAPLAELLATDHTVLTADPRGIHRSTVDDPAAELTVERRAADLAALIEHAGGPADVLGSSGGAVTVLELAQSRPDLVRTVVAHEPPLQELLPDREELRTKTETMIKVYETGDDRSAWATFFEIANIPMPAPALDGMLAHRSAQQLADERAWYTRMFRGIVGWVPDRQRLQGVRVVAGIGEASAGQLCDRTSRALAELLRVEPALFPGGHLGFADDPVAFEPVLRKVLGAESAG
jgi:pimeloyl-ACP methyl ester carboxylesterase